MNNRTRDQRPEGRQGYRSDEQDAQKTVVSDIRLAAFMMADEVEIIEAIPDPHSSGPRRGEYKVYIFRCDKKRADEYWRQYHNYGSSARVHPRKLLECYESLKTMKFKD